MFADSTSAIDGPYCHAMWFKFSSGPTLCTIAILALQGPRVSLKRYDTLPAADVRAVFAVSLDVASDAIPVKSVS